MSINFRLGNVSGDRSWGHIQNLSFGNTKVRRLVLRLIDPVSVLHALYLLKVGRAVGRNAVCVLTINGRMYRNFRRMHQHWLVNVSLLLEDPSVHGRSLASLPVLQNFLKLSPVFGWVDGETRGSWGHLHFLLVLGGLDFRVDLAQLSLFILLYLSYSLHVLLMNVVLVESSVCQVRIRCHHSRAWHCCRVSVHWVLSGLDRRVLRS